MEATTERPKRNGVMRRSRLANPTCWPRSLRTSSSRTDWNLLAIVINCWGAIRPSFRSSKGFGGLDGSFQKSPEFQEVRSSKPGLDSLSPYLCTFHQLQDYFHLISLLSKFIVVSNSISISLQLFT